VVTYVPAYCIDEVSSHAAARKLSGFELELVATDPQVPSRVFAELGVREVGLDELVETSDVVSIHSSLTPATHHLLGKDQIARMNPGAVEINTAPHVGAPVNPVILR
jgi:phosphoglycerate dehydrogenase-like enzyme